MLPLALKIVWLIFALLGIPATWAVLIPFASAIGTYWAFVLYSIAITILEGIFAIGTISALPFIFNTLVLNCQRHGLEHDSFGYAARLLRAQTVIIALCFHVLTGPYRSIQASASALLWRRAYYLFVVVFPVLASTAHLVVVLKLDSVRPMNDLRCDVTSPLWPRLLGYAGIPVILFTPCFILSIFTAVRLLDMHARLREFQTRGGYQKKPARAANNGSLVVMSRRSVVKQMNGVIDTDKLPSQSLDGQKAMSFGVQLRRSLTQFSSRSSLPHTPRTTETNSSNTYVTNSLPAVSPSTIYKSQPPPIASNKSMIFTDVDRGQTPSPIVFAPASIPSPHYHHAQCDAAEEPSHPHPSFYLTGPHYVFTAPVGDELAPSPASPSRARISLVVGERIPRYHLPSRPPPGVLRPSLELSPEYARVRLEEDHAALVAAVAISPSAPSYQPPLSPLMEGAGSGAIDSLPPITYTDHVLAELPEVDEADPNSIAKGEFTDELKVVLMDPPEPRLKPVRQFYRSAPRPSVGRPPGLDPAIWRLVAFQLAFFLILVLASLGTLIDLAKDQTPAPFGTQHIALLLVAWCPALIFGSLFSRRSQPIFPSALSLIARIQHQLMIHVSFVPTLP
ncbi:hypothetical protein B0F90DRAFT_1815539 [Multifurca ochricompacta]|uniref:Uncharacterized protein n=1 Tax=Multifurca ochricompacta TaxID=376703 RepID=A0AAD4M7K5_9AGAM|nr:hypothetical protein B0F90DRAFT_1815539 [Multifurca ochricompacta]